MDQLILSKRTTNIFLRNKNDVVTHVNVCSSLFNKSVNLSVVVRLMRDWSE